MDLQQIPVVEHQQQAMTFEEINSFIQAEIGRKIVVVGACTGTDAHTVGLDAIMNMKGYAGGLRFRKIPHA